MKNHFDSRLLQRLTGLLVACMVGAAGVFADEPAAGVLGGRVAAPVADDLNQLSGHPHSPLVVRSRPVIERLPVQVIQPVDLQVARSGNIFIADAQADCIFRLDMLSSVSLQVQDLAGIRRICLDADEAVYVLTAVSGESCIHQITPDGRRIPLHTLPFPAQCFARAGSTEWLAAEGRNLWHINTDSERTLLVRFTLPVLDLCSDAGGGNTALLADGSVLQVGLDGATRLAGYAPGSSRRLICQPDGRLVVLANASVAGGRGSSPLPPGIYPLVTSDNDSPPAALANLPEGTLAAGFDSLGNLCLANPGLRAVTRVTSRFRIPCPHCRESVLLIFDANAQPENLGGF